eukprot:CAMPEP_0117476792 /NCGR_PEP_ID=MMETSP0784-20121206/10491_1 /TAXON_ID=39447 /ORGANISM="" /LENGTH=149 /DNA_ID=CAMNT_0005271077 /DNA_START=71 /DNA_END=520 /DNA_ORIENTATION=-
MCNNCLISASQAACKCTQPNRQSSTELRLLRPFAAQRLDDTTRVGFIGLRRGAPINPRWEEAAHLVRPMNPGPLIYPGMAQGPGAEAPEAIAHRSVTFGVHALPVRNLVLKEVEAPQCAPHNPTRAIVLAVNDSPRREDVVLPIRRRKD